MTNSFFRFRLSTFIALILAASALLGLNWGVRPLRDGGWRGWPADVLSLRAVDNGIEVTWHEFYPFSIALNLTVNLGVLVVVWLAFEKLFVSKQATSNVVMTQQVTTDNVDPKGEGKPQQNERMKRP